MKKKLFNKIKLLSIVAMLVVTAQSCSRKDAIEETNPSLLSKGLQIMGAPSPVLNWSTLSAFDFGPNETVPSPWAGGASRSFPTDYLNDYKPEDGWELYFNTFNKVTKPADPFFIIYNRYRGIMRIYYFFVPKSGTETDKVTFQLDLNGTVNNSKILNFEQGEVIDQDIVSKVTSKVQTELIIQNGAWYAEEFQLAYDPNLENLSYANNQLRWRMYATTVDLINLDGIQKGTIDGTIQVPKATDSFFGQLVKGALSIGTGGLGVLAIGSKIAGNFFSKNFGPIKLDSVKKGIEGAAKDGLKNGGKSIFNAVLGQVKGGNGPDSTEQKVNLKLSTEIQLSGSIQHSPNGLYSPVVFISNTLGLTDVAPDYIPNYTKSLGVFGISNTPNVKIRSILPPVEEDPDPMSKKYIFRYYVDEESFTFIPNPDVINSSSSGAKIQNLTSEVILDYNPYAADLEAYSGRIEYLDVSKQVITNLPGSGIELDIKTPRHVFNPPTNTYVRISFDVVPNNGSPKTTTVKTFKATASLVN